VITQIDDDAVQGLTLDQAVKQDEGADQHPDQAEDHAQGFRHPGRPLRSCVKSFGCGPVRYHTEGGDIGYVRITSFNEQTTDGLRKAIADISKQIPPEKLAGFVVDLRNNPGGLLDQAVSVTSSFMARGRSGLDARPYAGRNPALHGAGAATSPRASRSWC